MILDSLVNQLSQRFQHEKRTRVCVWFDERREFARLLPALREHMAAMDHPPFHLLGYDEPSDFPLADRLPPVPVRPHHVRLLQRWLRDSESRGAWDHWIRKIESDIDLSGWAHGRPGLSFGLPHLVRQRWSEVRQGFELAAPKASATAEFFERHQDLIAREAEFGKASHAPIGAWPLLVCRA